MKNAISPATPRAASIGTKRIAGVPNNPAKRSDKTVVGSKVAADTSIEVKSIADMDDRTNDGESHDENGPSTSVPATGGRADNFVFDIDVVVAPTNDCFVDRTEAGENASQRIMTLNSWTAITSNIKCIDPFVRVQQLALAGLRIIVASVFWNWLMDSL